MKISEILSRCDHTLLSQSATFDDIRQACDDGMKYHTASVCIAPCFVKKAKEYVGDRIKIGTVVGFPNGYNTMQSKIFETENALQNGADEIDMVINVGDVKSGNFEAVKEEISAIKNVCGDKILKVIIETCLLSEQEKIKLCDIVSRSGADYIKTSTGFAGGGATKEDVGLMRKYVAPGVKVKAAGGISDLRQAEEYIRLGADRIGTSKIIKSVKNSEKLSERK